MLHSYRQLRLLLRQQWDGLWRRTPPGAEPAAQVLVVDQVLDQAMAKVQSHLGCMLDWAVDATQIDLPTAQRNRIQAEINQHVAAIDHIARTTAVGGMRLLDGSGGAAHGPAAPATPQAEEAPALPDLRAQMLSLHCISVGTPAKAWASQLRLEQVAQQLAQTRASVATAQLLARLAKAPASPRRAPWRLGVGSRLQGMVSNLVRRSSALWRWGRQWLQRRGAGRG